MIYPLEEYYLMVDLSLSGDKVYIYDDYVIKICKTNPDRFLKTLKNKNYF